MIDQRASSPLERVLALLRRTAADEGHPPPAGARLADVDTLEARFGRPLPVEVRAWLLACDGAFVGCVPLLGVSGPGPSWRIDDVWETWPEWRELGWIPLASDGCGDYMVLDTTARCAESHPVYFLEHERSLAEPDFIMASGLWPFLEGFIRSASAEAEWEDWPFIPEQALEHDPDLAFWRGSAPLPWLADEQEDRL